VFVSGLRPAHLNDNNLQSQITEQDLLLPWNKLMQFGHTVV